MASRKPKVVVVGAGFAGLGAARALLSDPKFDVTILEGTSKVGGRVRSLVFNGGHKVELGCTYLYYNRKEATALPKYAMKKGLTGEMEKSNGGFGELDSTDLLLLSNGERVPMKAVDHYLRIYLKISDELQYRSRTGDWGYTIDRKWAKDEPCNPEELTFNEYITKRFLSVTKSDPRHTDKKNNWKPMHILENLLSAEGIMTGSKMSEDVDLLSYGEYIDEEYNVDLPRGYQSVADALAKEIPPECIQLNKEVQSIQWTPTKGDQGEKHEKEENTTSPPVTLVCTDGSQYPADHVIVTVSLGVLKQRCSPLHPTPLFSPTLPEDKLTAIRKLGMGKMCKVVLEFPKRLVDDDTEGIEFFWMEEDHEYPEKYPWATKLYSVDHIPNSNIFITWYGNEDAIMVEDLTEGEIAEGICCVFEKFFQKQIPRPIRVEKSMWCKDKFFLGSWSFNSKGSNKRDREVLSEPISGSTPLQILFAGEATYVTMCGTTDGAFESGLREAQRLRKTVRR